MGKCYVDKIIDLALGEVGYKEKKTNEQLDDNNANAGHNNYNKYAKYIDDNYPAFYNTKKNGCDWCDIFVDYLFIKAYGYKDALRLTCQTEYSCGAGCTYSYMYYKANSQVGRVPKLGAQIFFSKNGTTCYHTGIVVDYDSETVTTVEGNAGDCVCKKIYSRFDSQIFGYGYPKYTEGVMKSTHEIALEVIDGRWGTGEERKRLLTEAGYDPVEVQKEVNKICEQSTSYPSDEDDDTLIVEFDPYRYSKIVIKVV